MMSVEKPTAEELDALWARHHAEWRETAQIISQWEEAATIDPQLLSFTTRGDWWEVLASTGMTLLVTREYEHLLMAMRVENETPHLSYMKLPHPSGLAANIEQGVVYVASTRNPNQVYDLAPVTGLMPRLDVDNPAIGERPLVPLRSRFFPGCLYMHDLALIGGELYANSVGQNAVVRLHNDGQAERAWWPRCIETDEGAVFGQNHIQLNSIAAGDTVEQSYFSASADEITTLRPGDLNYPVDKRGVIFSGETREPIARGLTRPHSARLHDGRIWVDNSGYGDFCVIENGGITTVTRLPGWTRGLGFVGKIGFVGTSRVIPRFRQYAPGLNIETSVCGLHAIDIDTGQVLGSLIWHYGNQIFALELVPQTWTTGFPFPVGMERDAEREKLLFYTFTTR
jgi:uncharacterized protein (TIGR03032 family)